MRNWPRLGVDAYSPVSTSRVPVAGEVRALRSVGSAANDLDEISQQAHLRRDYGRSFVIVGPGEDPKIPLISVEHPSQAVMRRNPEGDGGDQVVG